MELMGQQNINSQPNSVSAIIAPKYQQCVTNLIDVIVNETKANAFIGHGSFSSYIDERLASNINLFLNVHEKHDIHDFKINTLHKQVQLSSQLQSLKHIFPDIKLTVFPDSWG